MVFSAERSKPENLKTRKPENPKTRKPDSLAKPQRREEPPFNVFLGVFAAWREIRVLVWKETDALTGTRRHGETH
jgi:hypothetical protein